MVLVFRLGLRFGLRLGLRFGLRLCVSLSFSLGLSLRLRPRLRLLLRLRLRLLGSPGGLKNPPPCWWGVKQVGCSFTPVPARVLNTAAQGYSLLC